MINNRENFINEVNSFLRSEGKGMLISENHINEKHRLLIALIDKIYINSTILFRTDELSNITEYFKFHTMNTPTAGETIKFGHNFYQFDSYASEDSWSMTSEKLRIAIVYPIDQIKNNPIALQSIDDLYTNKEVDKVFFISHLNYKESDFSFLSRYIQRKCILDLIIENSRYFYQTSNSEGNT